MGKAITQRRDSVRRGDDIVLEKVVRLEAKVDLLVQMLAGNSQKEASKSAGSVIENLTTKQHAALQMLLSGASNAEIADRFEVSTNTAKVYVRSIASKLGVTSRNQIVVKCFDDYQRIDDEEYRVLSGGLPKHWHEDFLEPDNYKALYAMKTR